MKAIKVAFVSHDASRTGAPILLLRLIQDIKKKAQNLEIIILLKTGGELKGDFELLGKTFIWNSPAIQTRNLGKRVLIKLKLQTNALNSSFLKEFKNVDFIFNNTITNAALLKELPTSKKKVLSYFHELEVTTEKYATKDEITFLSNISNKIFIPSLAVKKFLTDDYGIPEEKLHFLNYVIPPIEKMVKCGASNFAGTADIPDNKFLVALCGTMHWRKGYEFLPLIARKIVLLNNVTDVHFIWIGADRDSFEYSILKNDLRKLRLLDYFTFIEPTEDITPYLSKVHLLTLPSREDAFPLVVLEAAALEVPSLCFAGAGGTPEFIGSDAGLIVSYLDTDAMAEAILLLKNDPVLRTSMGKCARAKADRYRTDDATVTHLISLLQ